MKKILIFAISTMMVLGFSGVSQAVSFSIDFEDGVHGEAVGTAYEHLGVIFDDLDPDFGDFVPIFDDCNGGYTNCDQYQRNGDFAIWSWPFKDGSLGVEVDFADDDIIHFSTGYASLGTMMMDVYLVGDPDNPIRVEGADTQYGPMGTLEYTTGGALIDRVVFLKPEGSFWYLDDMVGTARADAPVPEPMTLLLFGSGLVGLAGLGRKKLSS